MTVSRHRRKYRRNFSSLRIFKCLLITGFTHVLTNSTASFIANDVAIGSVNNVTKRNMNKKHHDHDYCNSSIIFNTWKTTDYVDTADRVLWGFVNLAILIYLFLGMAIVCDYFMTSIELIICSEKQIVIWGKDGKRETVGVRIWNETVANLTLISFGSSAPEILLPLIELLTKNFEAGDLGPGTIVGSAAYSVLVITAICISSPPEEEVRRIRHLRVFLVTAGWSLFACIWLYMIVAINSPERIEIWEGVLTLTFLPMMVFHACIAERICHKKRKKKEVYYDNSGENEIYQNINGFARKSFGAKVHQLEYIALLTELREKHPQKDIEILKIMAQKHFMRRAYKSRAFYRIQASREMTGRGNVINTNVYHALDHTIEVNVEFLAVDTNINIANEEDAPTHVFFEPSFYKVKESCGEFTIRVMRHGDMSLNTQVEYHTEPGTTKPGLDYISKKGLLSFAAGVDELSVKIQIIADDIFDHDDHFYVHLINPSYPAVLSEPFMATVLVLDDDHSGIFSFKEKQYELTESLGTYELLVERRGGARGNIIVPFLTEDGTAMSGKEYEGQEGELVFENNEIEKSIFLKIIDEWKYKKDVVFYVNLGKPLMASDDKRSGRIKLVESKEVSGLTAKEKIMLIGRPKIGSIGRTTMRIKESKHFQNTIDRLLKRVNAPILLGTSSWKEQFTEAFTVRAAAGDDDDEDDEIMPSIYDYAMHFITLFWKILFAVIPPTTHCNGYLRFVVSLAFIAILTAIISDAARTFGCYVGMSDTLTAITLVSIGTNVPDTFASRIAAIQDEYADNSISNITGGNAVNLFAGIGLAWSIGAIYHASKGKEFLIVPKSLPFAIIIYLVFALIALAVLLWRRRPPIGGELGGPIKGQVIHRSLFVFLYILYIVLIVFKEYGIIKG